MLSVRSSSGRLALLNTHMRAILGTKTLILFVTNVEIYSIRLHTCNSIQSIAIEAVQNCIMCDKWSKLDCHLKMHMLSHSGEKPHQNCFQAYRMALARSECVLNQNKHPDTLLRAGEFILRPKYFFFDRSLISQHFAYRCH